MADFSNKLYTISIQTRTTQIPNNLILTEKTVSAGFSKIIGVQNQLPIRFGTFLINIQTL